MLDGPPALSVPCKYKKAAREDIVQEEAQHRILDNTACVYLASSCWSSFASRSFSAVDS